MSILRHCIYAVRLTGQQLSPDFEVDQVSENDRISYKEWLAEAKAELRRFYWKLEDILKRHQPIDYASVVAERIRCSLSDFRKMAASPPHYLLHSIEANCAYSRGQNRDLVDWNRLARVMNVYHNHPDPFQTRTANESLEHCLLLLHREQMALQYEATREDIARVVQLFVTDGVMPRVSEEFEQKYGITPEQWTKLCFITFAQAQKQAHFTWESVSTYEKVDVPSEGIRTFFSLSSISPKAIGERFRRKRIEVPLQFHSLIRPVFLEKPLIDFGEGRLLCPHPHLVSRHLSEGLYRLARSCECFGEEFGKSFQQYVGRVLKAHRGEHKLFDSNQIDKLLESSSCDFLVETADAVLLVEAKGATFTADLLTDGAILNDNSTTKVAKAMKQIYSTAHGMDSDVFRGLGIDCEKPILGMVVTFGELPFANSEWYFNSFFLPRARTVLSPPIYPGTSMKNHPIVISVRTLEHLVTCLNNLNASYMKLFEEKEQRHYNEVGDWNTFLKSKLRDQGENIEALPFVRQQTDEFFNNLIRMLESS